MDRIAHHRPKNGTAKRKLIIYIDPGEEREIELAAAKLGRSKSLLGNEAILQYVREVNSNSIPKK